MKRSAPALASILVVSVACSGPSVPPGQGGGAVLDEGHPEAMRTPGFLQFGDLSLIPLHEGVEPRGAHVHGWLVGGLFIPRGGVVDPVAEPPRDRVLTPGYLELRTRAFLKKDAWRDPSPPFVEGWQDTETGGFHPSSGVHRAASQGPAPAGGGN